MPEFVCAYRFQLTPSDDFDRAAELVPYFRSLGVSHLYLSPIAEAEPGSEHGYDIVAPGHIRDELGGAAGFDRLCQQVERHGLAIILDIVPNHLSIATPELNPWFWHVLRHGQLSPYANAFDIDWESNDGQLLLPVLDRPLAEELDDIQIEPGDDGPAIRLSGGLRLPLAVTPGTTPDRSELTALLERQPYQLVNWRSRDRNHRRFFEIDTLAGVAVEDPLVRGQRHALLVRLLDRYPDLLAGVRVDHVDGLADPDDYLEWLRALVGADRLLLVEKIVIDDESLPQRWPVDGTTGYEFARLVDQLLLDSNGRDDLHVHWQEVTDSNETYASVERRSIEEVLRDRLHPEVERLHRLVQDVPELDGRDGLETIGTESIIALAAAMDRYRTYLPHGGPNDVQVINAAGARAAERTEHDESIASLVGVLTDPRTDQHRQAQTLFQQLTGPALAKGAEDRALYRYHPVSALNEVGGDPDAKRAMPTDFHRWAERSARQSPRQLLTTSTHDTKRSGDVRARLLALTHNASAWRTFHDRWSVTSTIHPADSYLLLQSVIGAWPIDSDRLGAYLVKALREASERSSWIEPDDAYEQSVKDAGVALLDDTAFIDDLEHLVATIEQRATANALIQTLLRLTAPGFGDLYRGSEVFDRSLVDPDNRRPVHWQALIEAVDTSAPLDITTALERSTDLAKIALIVRVLGARRANVSDLSNYRPLSVDAANATEVVAFARDRLAVVAVTGRMDTAGVLRLPAGRWRSALRDGGRIVNGDVPLTELVNAALPLDCLVAAD